MSPILKSRVSGAWVDSDRAGAVRLSGVTIPFGPGEDPGPTYEAIDWVSAPALTDASDGPTSAYHMGCSFSVLAEKPCYGLRWRVPDSLLTPSVGFWATLFRISPTLQLKKQAITPVAGGDQDFLWVAPEALEVGETYICGITTIKYSFRSAASAGGFPFSSPSGNVVASIGRLADPADPDAVPSSNFESIYYVSPLVGV